MSSRAKAYEGGHVMEAGMNLIGGVGLEAFLMVAAMLFVIGIFGIFLNRKNVIEATSSIPHRWLCAGPHRNAGEWRRTARQVQYR